MNRSVVYLLVLAFFVCASSAAPSKPTWPSKYFLTGTFSIPYFNISQPVIANYDSVTNRQRFDYYASLTSYLSLNNVGKQYEEVPRLDRKTCFVSNSSGPLTQLLPDMSVFNYRGAARVNGWLVENWEQRTLNFSRVGVYNFYVHRQPDGTVRPIRFAMNGHDNVFDSHPDVYIFDYNAYIPDYNTPDAWTVSTVCKNAEPATPSAAARARMHHGGLALLFGSVPQSEQVDAQEETKLSARVVKMFEEHCQQYGKHYPHSAEYKRRLRIFNENLEFIESWNKKQTGSVLAMNHFGDWSREEFLNVMLPKSRNKRAISVNRVREETDEEKARLTAGLPSTVDWVSAGAVTPVKDQGICGSCWTFGTTGTIEGAHFIKHRQLVSLSEQQIVDCAWGYQWSGPGGNLGCDGGYAAGALQWVMDNNGIATEQSYKYLMQDAFCLKGDTSSGVQLKGYVNVTAFSEAALQQAVAIGPVAVAIDASHPAFTYYSSGVIYQPDCKNDIPDLDHEVLAVGYGTYQGQDYWLVKNSWSTHWGINGYVMMARNRGNNCGIASQANYAIAA